MEKRTIENLKQTVEAIKESLRLLKTKAVAISDLIDAEELIPADIANELTQALEYYQQQERQLNDIGNELTISFGTKLSDISATIHACEEKQSLGRLRDIVLDYLRLNSEDADIKNASERSKLLLIKKCVSPIDQLEKNIAPYEMVVSTVKRGTYPLPKDKFQRIMKDVDFEIAFATDRAQLFIDYTIDVSKYADGSLPMLTISEKAPERLVIDADTKTTKADSEPNVEPLTPEPEISEEPKKARRWESYGGYVTEVISVNFADIKKKPSLEEIKHIERQNHDAIVVLWNAANEKLIPVSNAADAGSRILSPNAIKQLRDSGLLTKISITDRFKVENYLTLSSKGWECFAKSDIKNYLAKQNTPLMIPSKLCVSCDAWTSLFTVRSALIHDYCRKNGKNYVMWKADNCEMTFAKPAEQSFVTIFAGLFQEYSEETDLKEMATMLDSLEDNAVALIVVRQYEDITVLVDELKALASHEVKALFAVVEKDYAVFDSFGRSSKLPEDISRYDTALDDTLTDATKPDSEVPKMADPMMLTTLNSIKTNAANASKFKKDIVGLSKQHKEICTILPLLTKTGVLEREQIFNLGVCLDCFAEDENINKQVHGAIDLLCSKGLLAQYQYQYNGKTVNVYGLADYCFGSMRKKEIDSMHIWHLSRGNRNISCGRTFGLERIERIVNANAVLLQYFNAARVQFDEPEYFNVKKSIKWAVGYYSVDCFWENEKFSCCLFIEDLDTQTVSSDNIILPREYIQDVSKYSGQFKKIFIIDDGKVCLFGNEAINKNKVEFTGVEDALNEIHERDTKSKDIENFVIAEIENTQPEEPKGGDTPVTETTADMNPGETNSQRNNKQTKTTTGTELTTPLVTQHPNNVPSDEEFCERVSSILNCSVHTEQELFSSVSNALILARTAGFINGYASCKKLSRRLQHATNILFDNYSYCSDDLTAVFADAGLNEQAITIAAYCFAMLTPAEAYDYSLISQSKEYFNCFERYFPDYSGFKTFFNILLSVRDVIPTGFSPAVVSLLGNEDESKNYINTLQSQAKGYLVYAAPKTRLKSLPIMYGACFGPGSDLHECMSIIAENRLDDLDYVKAVLGEYSSEKNGTLILDDCMIEDKLNAAWDEANPKNKFKLEYGARAQALKHLRLRLELMLTWSEQLSVQKKRDDNLVKLKVLREELLNSIIALETDNGWQYEYCSNIIRFMFYRIKTMLNGQTNDIRIFSELLHTGVISLDKNWLPILNEALTEVRFNEPWRNAIRHIEAEKKSVSDIKDEILGTIGDESGLLDNLHQLRMLGLRLGGTDEDFAVSKQQYKDAKEAAKLKTEKLRETLELAYTYNQINETEKETLASIVKQNENDFFEVGDFACWRRFLEGLEKQIEEYAKGRQADLRVELNTRKDKVPDSTLLAAASKLLENDRNFAVTEEYINRFDNGETELSEELEAILYDVDYFSDFLSPQVFSPLFELCKNRSGSALKSFGWSYLEKRLPKDWTARQRKDSEELVSSWPVRKNMTTSSSIQTLFTCLGFAVKNATKASGYKEEIFKLTVAPTVRSKADYLHPIAAFGTQLKSPVNIIVLYGNYTEKQLVDTVSSLDFGGISIVLIDRPVETASRRQIGEIFHTQTSGQNQFLLIDQVLLLYLAMHQITERLPALLKCSLPYSSYQPFVQDSGSTSDEMFCGRTRELARIIDPNGVCVVYGGRQLGKTALLQRAESRCMNPESKSYAVYVSILKLDTEAKVVEAISSAIRKKTNNSIAATSCDTVKALCDQLGCYFRSGAIARMHLLIDEVDDFLAAIAPDRYIPIQPFVDLRRETTNNFKFVIAGLHNVCRAKNATTENGIFGQLGTPLCIKPLSPTDALQLLSRPLRYLGFQIDRYPHLETILTNTNYYPGILQFFGYMLVETLSNQYSKYYRAANGNPPFTLHNDQLGAVMNSADLNRSIKDKFRWSLELDKRYFMMARCITMLYHYYEDDRHHGSWLGFSVDQIIDMAEDYNIHCLEKEAYNDYVVLLDEMVDMGILSKPGDGQLYRLRRSSFVDIIGESFDVLDAAIISNNEEA